MQVEGRCRRGIVLDLSTGGLFVQSASPPPPGAVVEVRLLPGAGRPEIALRARVARQQRVDPRLARIQPNGVGLEILDAPPAFRELVEERQRAGGADDGERSGGAARDPERKPPPADPAFRVRIAQSEGTRSRTLTVRASGAEAARGAALAQMGEGWEVVEVSAGEPPRG